MREDARILVAKQELKLAELRALKSAGICQEATERKERNRRNGFNDINLLHHGLQDGEHALQCCARFRYLSGDQAFSKSIAFMELLFEPQFIYLVNDDEQHLIMFRVRTVRAVRKWPLQGDELRNAQVIAVGQVHDSILFRRFRAVCR